MRAKIHDWSITCGKVPLGRMVLRMRLPWNASIEALARELQGTCARLERLETAPSPELDLKALEGRRVLDHRELSAKIEAVEVRLKMLDDALEGLDGRLRTMTHAVAEGIERTDRAERRIKATVRRARAEFAEFDVEHAGLEAEAGELRLIDAGGSDGRRVPTVREEVEEAPEPPTSIETIAGKLRMMGMGR